MNGKKYNFCLIGAGRMGKRWAKILQANNNAILSIIVDKDEKAGNKLAKECNVKYLKYPEEALKNSDINAVIIVTPHKYLYPLSLLALTYKKHILIEKPGSQKPIEMKTLISLAKQNECALMVGFNYRFFDSIIKAKQLILKNEIGEINFMRIRHGHPGRPDYDKEWRMNKNIAGGGALIDQGSHLIDLVNWFLPFDIKEVKSVMNNIFWKSNVEETAFVSLKNINNQIASIHVSVTQWDPIFSLEIYGSKGFISINGLGKKYGGSEVLTIGKYNNVLDKQKIICNPDSENALNLELKEFIYAIKNGLTPITNGYDALKVLEIIEQIYEDR